MDIRTMPILDFLKLFGGILAALFLALFVWGLILFAVEYLIMRLNGSRERMKRLDGDQYFDEP